MTAKLHLIHVPCFAHDYTPWRVLVSVGRRQDDPPGHVVERRFCKCVHCGHVKIDPIIF